MYFKNVNSNALAQELLEPLQKSMETEVSAYDCNYQKIISVDYDSLSKDPITTVQGIYDFFGFDYSFCFENKMNLWLKKNRKHQNGTHAYSLAQFGVSETDIDKSANKKIFP